MSTPANTRYAEGGTDADGNHVFNWRLTTPSLTGDVHLMIPPPYVLPVVFVPGIMGSNLREKSGRKTPIWRLDEMHGVTRFFLNHGPLANKPMKLVRAMAFMKAGDRQKIMNPALLEVDPGGHVPDEPVGSIAGSKEYTSRGWGEVGESSYQSFLIWLEKHLNGHGYNPATWKDFYYMAASALGASPNPILPPSIPMHMPGLPDTAEVGGDLPAPILSDDLIKRAAFRMPVYACGYNWLASNLESAIRLQRRINHIIAENNTPHSQCKQVIVVTHSMGGLVARACQKLSGMQDKIAGIVHGVMPTVGAAVAYRRCKVGMRDEDPMAGMVIGETGQAVTAVFAQSPGALQLLPMTQYDRAWLNFEGAAGKTVAMPQPATGDPYQDIYLCKDHWWGLVRPEWLAPLGGTPISWAVYTGNVVKSKQLDTAIRDAFHPTTYVFYGDDPAQKSFNHIQWAISPGTSQAPGTAPALDEVPNLGFGDVRASGNNPIYVGGQPEQVYTPNEVAMIGYQRSQQTSFWQIQCGKQDSGGDGTVPISSGAAPKQLGGGAIKQQFGLKGFAHEGAYRDATAQIVSLYGIVKIAAAAQVPA